MLTDTTEPRRPGKRLALFFDGTWNIPESNTNVWRLSLMLSDHGADGVRQEKFYDEGVGAHWLDRLTGGAFGLGLSENVCQGYRWLMEHYDPGDEIFIFGFSRGAFTARSLAGIIARCGLLQPDAPMSFEQVFERYQKGDTVRPIYLLKYLQHRGVTDFDFNEQIILRHTYYGRNFIKLVGVWDTVGSIGVPFGSWKGISRRTLRFHNTNLTTIVQHSYQALALDEQRHPFWAILWTTFIPDQPDESQAPQVDNRMVEQRWFVGAHANVGGGYRDDLLPQRPLAWIQKKAHDCGLSFRATVTVNDEEPAVQLHDSYAEFLAGLWKLLGKRYVRWVMADPVRKAEHWDGTNHVAAGEVRTVNERIDLSVIQRCQRDTRYRPASLVEWATRHRLDLNVVIATPELYPQAWSPVTASGVELHAPFDTIVA
jgi:uncharacterized protein (DUF2235 family)